jgi:hypothetical protein
MADTSAIEKFLHAVETASIPGCDAWSADATLDATVPNWRLHAAGADAIRAEYAKWFAHPGRFDELRRYTVEGGEARDSMRGGLPGGSGGMESPQGLAQSPPLASTVVEYTLSWTENGVPHAGHHLHVLTVRDDRIVADMVFCGGRWPAALLAEMEAARA